MPPILIEPVAGDYFDYESKYASGGARELCPAPVSPAVTAEVQRLALAAHKALGLKGYSRADFILGPDDSLHLLEVNTLPGMTPTSLVPQEAAQLGMDFGQLLEKLIELGMEQHPSVCLQARCPRAARFFVSGPCRERPRSERPGARLPKEAAP